MKVDAILAALGILAASGIVAQFVSTKMRIPRVAVLLLLGLALGIMPATQVGLDALRDRLSVVAEAILVIVLFYGGLSIDIEDMSDVLLPGTLLATVGALLTTTVVGLALFAAIGNRLVPLDWGLLPCLIFGASIAPNDPIATFSALDAASLNRRADTIAKFEAGLDDTMVTTLVLMIFLPMMLAGQYLTTDLLLSGVIHFIRLSVLAVLMGWVGGIAGNWVIHRLSDEDALIKTLGSAGVAAAVFLVGQRIGASGYVAVFVLGLVLARKLLGQPAYATLREHWRLVFRLGESATFLMLGALVNVSALGALLPATLFVVGVLLLLARPWAVGLCTSFTDLSLREKLHVGTVALKGLDPAVLSIAVVGATGGHGELIDLTFSAILGVAVAQTIALLLQNWFIRRRLESGKQLAIG